MNDFDKDIHILEQTIPYLTRVAIGVSGGPDSMYTASLVCYYYKKKGWGLENITILHFNHHQRTNSQKECDFVVGYFSECYRIWNTYEVPPDQTETQLRTHRHEFFKDTLLREKIQILLLGHNLSDRIETSLLNIVRGASIEGFLSIQPTTQNTGYTIIRPLLSHSKKDIVVKCERNNIPYIIDTSNSLPITPRNVVRNTIIPALQNIYSTHNEKVRNKSRTTIFNDIEKKSSSHTYQRVEHKPHPHWGWSQWFSIPQVMITPKHIYEKMKTITYPKQETIISLYEKLYTTTELYQTTMGGVYFCVLSGHIHCLYKSKTLPIRKKYIKKITQTGYLQFDGKIYSISKERLGCVIRYPQPGDIYHKKPLMRVLTNKKVPQFMRKTVAVIAQGKEIISILI